MMEQEIQSQPRHQSSQEFQSASNPTSYIQSNFGSQRLIEGNLDRPILMINSPSEEYYHTQTEDRHSVPSQSQRANSYKRRVDDRSSNKQKSLDNGEQTKSSCFGSAVRKSNRMNGNSGNNCSRRSSVAESSMLESSNRQMGEYQHSANTSQVNLQPDQTITTLDQQNTARIVSERDKKLSKSRMQNAYPSQSMNVTHNLTPNQTALGSITPSAESSVTYLEKMLV